MLNRLSLLQRKDLPTLTKQSARRVAVNLANYTNPFGLGENIRQRQVKAIASDTAKVFKTPATVAKFEMDEGQRKRFGWIMANKPNIATRFLKSIGLDYKVRKTAQPKVMKSARVYKGRPASSRVADVIAPKESIAKIRSKAEKRIGLAKYGWAMAARALGGTRGLPAWITRSKGAKFRGAGSATVHTGENGTQVTLRNNVPYAASLINKGAIRLALNREAAFLTQEIRRRVSRR